MEREREGGGGVERAETSRKVKRGGLRSDRREPGGSNWQWWLELEKCTVRREPGGCGWEWRLGFSIWGLFSSQKSQTILCVPSIWAALFGERFQGRTNKFSFQIFRLLNMWGTSGKLRELKINLHQWEPCINYSLRCYGDDCKPSGRAIQLWWCRALVFQSACRADDVEPGQGQTWPTLCTSSAKEAICSACLSTGEIWRPSLNPPRTF